MGYVVSSQNQPITLTLTQQHSRMSEKDLGVYRINPYPEPAILTLSNHIRDRKEFNAKLPNWSWKNLFRIVAKDSFGTASVIEDCPRRLRGDGNKCISLHAILDNFHAFGYKGDVTQKYKRFEWDSMWLTLESTCLQEMFIFKRRQRFKVGCRCCGEDITHMLGRDFTSISELLTILPFLAMFHRVLAPL